MSNAASVQVRKRGRPVGSYGPTKAAQAEKESIKKDAPQQQYFMLCNGKPVKNIRELAEIMDSLEDHVFNHHVGENKNDFAAWVKDVFKDVELAQKLTESKDKKHMQLVVYRHLANKFWQ